MNTMINLTKSEWTKIISRSKSKVLLILLSFFVVGAGVVYYFLQNKLNVTLMEGTRFPTWTLDLLMGFLLPLFMMLLMGDTFAGEFQDGTIKNVFAAPASRGQLYASKLLAAALYASLMLGVVAGFSIICSLIVSGFSVFGGLGSVFLAYLGAWVILGLIIVMAGLVSLFVGSSSLSLVFNLLLWLGMSTVGTFVPSLHTYLPTSFLHWYEPLITHTNFKLLVPMLLYMLSYYIILTILGALKFQKKEV